MWISTYPGKSSRAGIDVNIFQAFKHHSQKPISLMKLLIPTLAVAALAAGCASSNRPAVTDAPSQTTAEAIKAFDEICLKTAPTFTRAASAAGAFGISDLSSLGTAKMGFNGDQSLGVQIKEGVECVITTPSKTDRGLTRSFQQSVARAAGVPPASSVPFRADVAGQTFVFQHDRSGGEAYVMLKAGK